LRISVLARAFVEKPKHEFAHDAILLISILRQAISVLKELMSIFKKIDDCLPDCSSFSRIVLRWNCRIKRKGILSNAGLWERLKKTPVYESD